MARKALLMLSTLATALVVAGFAMFCLDELGEGSRSTIARLDGDRPSPNEAAERERERDAGAVREALSDANDVLLDPFSGIAAGWSSAWARHGVPALLAFLAYGVLLRMLAAQLPEVRPQPRGWATPR